MAMEFAVGRASKQSVIRSFGVLTPDKKAWSLWGYIAWLGNYVLMMFYTVVTGWMIAYTYYAASGRLAGLNVEQVGAQFGALLSSPGELVFWLAMAVLFGGLICYSSLQGGVENITKVMMAGLLALMLALAVRSVTLEGSEKGLEFYLKPDFGKLFAGGLSGFGTVIYEALGQAFFTLSVGIGSMAIFGSYIDKDRALMGESVNVIVLDTLVALLAGFIMFPACFSYGLEVGAGPSLLFDTMATVFNNMAGGRFWGTLFFLFMVFAAMSTVLAVCENILAMTRDLFGWSRPKGSLICGIVVFLLGLTTALGYSVFTFQPFAEGSAWLDFWDFIVSTNCLPIGSLVFALFCCNKFGWGWDNFVKEANTGKGLKVQPWMKPIFQFCVPAIIVVLYVYGLATFGWR